MKDLDTVVRYRVAKRRWLEAQQRAYRLGYLGGLSLQSIPLYRSYMDAYSDLIHSGDSADIRPKMTFEWHKR